MGGGPSGSSREPNLKSTLLGPDIPSAWLLQGGIMTFNYGLPAELFVTKRKSGPRSRRGCRRFATAAEAIRFAVEDFPAISTLGAWMLVGNERFDVTDIHRLYESDDYPLRRRTR